MPALRFFLLASCCLLAGCSGESPSTIPVPLVGGPEAAAIKALQAAGAEVKTDAGGSATAVDLHGATLESGTLELLAELKSLNALNLADSSFSDADVPTLEKVSLRLSNLDLRGCPISNKATGTIARFTALRALRFSGKNGYTSIDDDGVISLAPCKALVVLALDELSFVGTDGISALSGLAELQELYLAGTTVDDETCKVIAKLPKLKKLRLSRNQISDDGLEVLASCSGLVELDLSEDSLITDAGMSHLALLTGLKKLNLWRVQISDEGALKLAPLTQLDWLNLDNTKLSDAGLPALKGMTSLTFLHLGSTQITAAGAPDLFHLKSLKDLKITRTALGASNSAVSELKKNLPYTSIQTEYVQTL